jgi:hypothetical protein
MAGQHPQGMLQTEEADRGVALHGWTVSVASRFDRGGRQSGPALGVGRAVKQVGDRAGPAAVTPCLGFTVKPVQLAVDAPASAEGVKSPHKRRVLASSNCSANFSRHPAGRER